MSVLNNADDVFIGTTEVDSVYLGENLIWYRGASIEVINNSGSTIHRLQTGDTLNLSTTVASGYVFDTWTLSGGGSLSNATSQNGAVYTSDGTDATITASYIQSYTLNIDNNGNTSTATYNATDVVNLPAMNVSSGYIGTWTVTQGSGTIDTSANPMTFTHTSGAVVDIELSLAVDPNYRELEFEFVLISEGNEDPVTLADPAGLHIGNTAIQSYLNAPSFITTNLSRLNQRFTDYPFTEGIGVYVHECNGSVASGNFNSWDQFGTGACPRKAGYSSELNSTFVPSNKKIYPKDAKLIFEPTMYVANTNRSSGDADDSGHPQFCLIKYEILDGDSGDWVDAGYPTLGMPKRSGECYRTGMFTLSQNTKIRATLGVASTCLNFQANTNTSRLGFNCLLFNFNDNLVGDQHNHTTGVLQAWTCGVPYKMSVNTQQYHNKLSFDRWYPGSVTSGGFTNSIQKTCTGYNLTDSTAYFVVEPYRSDYIWRYSITPFWNHEADIDNAYETENHVVKEPLWPLHYLNPLKGYDVLGSGTIPYVGHFGMIAQKEEGTVRLVFVDTQTPSANGQWNIDPSIHGYTLPLSGSTTCSGFPEIGPNGTWSHLTGNSSQYNTVDGMEASFPNSTTMHMQFRYLYDANLKTSSGLTNFDPPRLGPNYAHRAYLYLSPGDSVTIYHEPSSLPQAPSNQDIDEWILCEEGVGSSNSVLHRCVLETFVTNSDDGVRNVNTFYAGHENNLLNSWVSNPTTSSVTITVPTNYTALNSSGFPDIFLYGKNDLLYSTDGSYKRASINLSLPGGTVPSDIISSISVSATGGTNPVKYKVVTRPTGVSVPGSDSSTTEGNSLILDCSLTATVTVGISTYTTYKVDGFNSTTSTSGFTWSNAGDGFISNPDPAQSYPWGSSIPASPTATETKTLTYSIDVYNTPSRDKGDLVFVDGTIELSTHYQHPTNPFRLAGTASSTAISGRVGPYQTVRRTTTRPNLIHTAGSPNVALPLASMTQFSVNPGRLAYIGTDGYIYVGGTNVPWEDSNAYNGTNPSTKNNYDQADGPLQYELGKHWNSQSTHPYNITDSIPSMLGLAPDDGTLFSYFIDIDYINYNSYYPSNQTTTTLYSAHKIQGYSIRKTNFQGSYVEIGDGCIFYVANNGDLYSAGNNTANGILGRGQFDGHQTVGKVGTVSNVEKVKVSKDSPIARTSLITSDQSKRGCVACLQSNGYLYWWGDNAPHKIINSSTNRYNTPQLITTGVDDFDLTPWNLVVLKSGKLYVYGDDIWDVRSDRTSNSDSLPNSSPGRTPRPVTYVSSPDNINTNYTQLTNVAHFAIGHHCLVAVTSSGAIYAGGRLGAEGSNSSSTTTGNKVGASVQGEVDGAMRFVGNIPSGKTVRSLKGCRHDIYVNYTDNSFEKLYTYGFNPYDLDTESTLNRESHEWQLANVKDFELGWNTIVFGGQTYDFTNA